MALPNLDKEVAAPIDPIDDEARRLITANHILEAYQYLKDKKGLSAHDALPYHQKLYKEVTGPAVAQVAQDAPRVSLKDSWNRFSRGDQIVLVLAEALVLGLCVSLLVVEPPTAADRSIFIVVIVLFAVFQVIPVALLWVIASNRRTRAATPPTT